MSDKVASASTSISAPTASLPTVEEINEWTRDRVKEFLQEKSSELDFEGEDINIIYNQRVKGDTLLDFTVLDFERWEIPGAPAKKLERLLKQIKGEQPSVKQTYDQADLADNSAKICGELIQRFETIPTKAEELQSLINRQLLRKLPVTSDEEQIYPEIKDYVCTTENERQSTIAKNISSAFTIDMKFSENKSESMLHYPIDAMIRVPLETFNKYIGGALPIEIDRDTTMIGSKRPDFLCWTKKLLLFKGEEKASSGEFNTAVEELEEKFNVLDPICFGKIQFMIGYAVAGSTV
ncbi:unnamed protein product [Rhizophagus irregularis]|uniref:Crinkler family protein n=1 Tax=Rhizophagus irregularis TaxID=588596 RepID=A0A916E5V3_9GLOM|nr:unnamed protein product [Rhizophagus irregularis]